MKSVIHKTLDSSPFICLTDREKTAWILKRDWDGRHVLEVED
jgi:hypothetical protein